jgi:MYXO-CTERM domain-containing protein
MTAPVVAEQAYRYWTYWVLDAGQWSFSQVAPAGTLPQDGAVQGWRFAVTTIAGSSSSAPRTDPALAFERACAGTTAPVGSKRIAVVIDPGEVDSAPLGESAPPPRAACAVVDGDATGAKALSTIADLRVEDGLVCAIDGYPARECAITLDSDTASSSSTKNENAPAQSLDVLSTTSTLAPTEPVSVSGSPASGSPAAVGLTAVLLLAGLCLAWWLQRRRLRGTR